MKNTSDGLAIVSDIIAVGADIIAVGAEVKGQEGPCRRSETLFVVFVPGLLMLKLKAAQLSSRERAREARIQVSMVMVVTMVQVKRTRRSVVTAELCLMTNAAVIEAPHQAAPIPRPEHPHSRHFRGLW